MNDRAQAMVDPWPITTFVVVIVVALVYSEIRMKLGDTIGPTTDLCGCGFQFTLADGLAVLGVSILVAFAALLTGAWWRYHERDSNTQ